MLGGQRADEVDDVADGRGVEAGGGLVEEEHLGLVQQRPRQGDALALSGRRPPHRLVGAVAHAEPLEHLADAASGQLVVEAPDACGGQQVLDRREALVEPRVLGEHARVAPHLVGVDLGVDAEHLGPATVGAQHAVEQADRGGLAGAVGAQQGQHLAGLDAQREVVERDTTREAAGQLVGLDRWVAQHISGRGAAPDGRRVASLPIGARGDVPERHAGKRGTGLVHRAT